MVSSIILDPHTIIKQAGMMEHATSNAAGLRSCTGMIMGMGV
jgi:hypothetical protein